MTDNLSPRAVETNSPYSYGSAPVASFQLIQRVDPKAELAGYIQYHADGLARALVDGRAHVEGCFSTRVSFLKREQFSQGHGLRQLWPHCRFPPLVKTLACQDFDPRVGFEGVAPRV